MNIDLPGPFGFFLNCDSPEFLRLAHDPGGLLEPGNYRTSRPGIVLLAAALSRPLFWVGSLASRIPVKTDLELRESDRASALARCLPAYAAYVLINACTLVLAFILYFSILHRARPQTSDSIVRPECAFSLPVLAAGSLLLLNDVTKAFFWSPHTQLFNIMAPVFCCWTVLAAWRDRLFEKRRVFPLTLLAGFVVTVYPSFLLFYPCLILPAAVRSARAPLPGETAARFVKRAILLLLVFALPYGAWYLFVTCATGAFSIPEISRYGQGVRVLESLRSGVAAFVGTLLSNAVSIIRGMLPQSLAALALMAFFLVLRRRPPAEAGCPPPAIGPIAAASLFTSLLFLVFFSFVGYHPPRIAYSLVPPLIVLDGALASAESPALSRLAPAVSVSAALAYGLFIILKDGPYY